MNALRFIVCVQILLCLSGKIKTQEHVLEKFDYKRIEAGNGLGIYTKVIAHVFREAKQTTEEWRLNREYLPDDMYNSLMSRCQKKESGGVSWSGCISDKAGLFAFATWGIPEPKNKTITYLEVTFKPFKAVNDDGVEEMCILEEVYKHKVYFVLRTMSQTPGNDTFPRDHIESVANVHQHQLDEIGKHFMSIFEDKIDIRDTYSFGEDEYYDRDPPYECFLSIGSSESVSVIKQKCEFYCTDINMDEAELEKTLYKAKDEYNNMESKHDEL